MDNRNTRFLVEFRKIEAERDSHYVTTNFEQAKKKAKSMATDKRFKDIKLHRITIEKTWLPVASVEFQGEEDKE